MKTKIILIKPAPRKRNWLRALYIITKRTLRKINDEKLIVLLSAMVFLMQLFIILTALGAPMHASAQDSVKGVPAKSAGLQIGDRVPDVTITNIINHPTGTAKISDFKGKLLILDFWASWCGACIVTIPGTDSLQKQFEGKVQFLPIAYQQQAAITPFLDRLEKNQGIKLTTAVGDKLLSSMFPHQTFPHYVWIDGNGIVQAITEFREVTAANIQRMLEGQEVAIREKKDFSVPYNRYKPLFINNNGGVGNEFQYRTIFTRYMEGIPGGSGSYVTDSTFRITAANTTVRGLFRTAFGDKQALSANKILIEVRDPSKITSTKVGAEYIDWLRTHGYTYELIVPRELQKQAHSIMRADLDRLLPQYSASLENRKTRVLVLQRTSRTDKLKSKGGPSSTSFNPYGFTLKNFPLQRLVDQLNIVYMQKSPMPVINETEYTYWVDMVVQANLSDPTLLNAALAPYDLRLVETERMLPRLVIRDRAVVKEQSSSHKQ